MASENVEGSEFEVGLFHATLNENAKSTSSALMTVPMVTVTDLICDDASHGYACNAACRAESVTRFEKYESCGAGRDMGNDFLCYYDSC